MRSKIREHRENLGWSQADLAERSGVSRQLVSAVESGRHIPSVSAALALGRSLGCSVEELFGPVPGSPVSVFEDALPVADSPVLIARVGESMVAVPVDHGVASSERWALADATLNASGTVSMLPDGADDGLLIAGCDPALGVLASLVERGSRYRVVAVHASTGRSLRALTADRVHGVVVHAPDGQLPAAPVEVQRWHLARWQVGVASGRVSGVPTIEEIAERRLRVVQREDGAGTQLAFNRALERIGAPTSIPGPVGNGHIDIARQVAAGAPAGLTTEAAARSFGLGFEALEEHTVEVWLNQRWATLPAAVELISTLGGASLRSRLELIGGYDLSSCADRIA